MTACPCLGSRVVPEGPCGPGCLREWSPPSRIALTADEVERVAARVVEMLRESAAE